MNKKVYHNLDFYIRCKNSCDQTMLKQVIYIFKISVFVKNFKKLNPQDLKYKNIICKFYKLRYKYVHAFKKKKNGINIQKNSGSTETDSKISELGLTTKILVYQSLKLPK